MDSSLNCRSYIHRSRFGHSQIANACDRRDPIDGQEKESPIPLAESFFTGMSLVQESEGRGMDRILAGMADQKAMNVDRFFASNVTNKMLGFMDLVANNIQRGRDHGLPAYSEFREYCGLEPVCDWSRRPPEISMTTWNSLKSVYR